MTPQRVELHMLRTGDRFRTMGATLRADSVGPNVVVATVLEGAYSGARPVATPGQAAYIPTGGARNSLVVELVDDPRGAA